MSAKLIAEIGSTHGNSKQYIDRAARMCAEHGAWLKVQVFGKTAPQCTGGNIHLESDVLAYASDRCEQLGVRLIGSFWQPSALLEASIYCDCAKIAFSAKDDAVLTAMAVDEGFEEVFISQQHLDPVIEGTTRLLCIPQYPCYFDVNFDRCFPPFDGFSDHTLGIDMAYDAKAKGARYIEKHVAFKGAVDCPDARFAIGEDDFEILSEMLSK